MRLKLISQHKFYASSCFQRIKTTKSEYLYARFNSKSTSQEKQQSNAINQTKGDLGFSTEASNKLNFNIIDTTLREGEQFADACFTTETKIEIAKALDEIGVDYIELTSPVTSHKSRNDCIAISRQCLNAKILTHTRCTIEDVKLAIDTGVDGVNIFVGTSSLLQKFSHTKTIDEIIGQAIYVVNYVKNQGLEVRLSAEDTFRSNRNDILRLFKAVDEIGVNRIGIADSVGYADPREVYDLVKILKDSVNCDIECHFHNDTGCAIANSYAAFQAGATHFDTSVIGIGERNGITPLGGLLARIYTFNKEFTKNKYNLKKIHKVEKIVAEAVGVTIPFNNYITGYCAFTHKAGIHAKAVLANPSTYEVLDPLDFGLMRRVIIGHRLTGWHGVKKRITEIGLDLTDGDTKVITAKIKMLADYRPLSLNEVDSLIRTYYGAKVSGDLNSFVDNLDSIN